MVALAGESAILEACDTASKPSSAVAPTPILRMKPQAEGARPCVGRMERIKGASCNMAAKSSDNIWMNLFFMVGWFVGLNKYEATGFWLIYLGDKTRYVGRPTMLK